MMLENIYRPGGLALTARSAKAAGIRSTSKVLDIGCGTGATLQFLKEKYGCTVCGADLSQSAAERSRKSVPDAEIRCEDAAALSFRDNTFDAAFMECTLTLFEDPAGALKEAFRVLKPFGTLVISALICSGPEPIREGTADPEKLMRLLEQTGFIEITYSDEKEALTRFYYEIILEYGSLEAYREDAEKQLGGIVLSCGLKRKGISYGVFVCRKTGEMNMDRK